MNIQAHGPCYMVYANEKGRDFHSHFDRFSDIFKIFHLYVQLEVGKFVRRVSSKLVGTTYYSTMCNYRISLCTERIQRLFLSKGSYRSVL